MTRSETLTHLATALAKAQAEMPVAVFDAQNKFLNNKYASLGAVIEASRPILAKHQLSLVQFPISGHYPACGQPLPSDGRGASPAQPSPGAVAPRAPAPAGGAEKVQAAPASAARGDGGSATGNRPTECIGVESMLMHESGEFVAERILIPLTEEKGKTKVQCAGSTLTYLRRYSWASILGMYSDEDSDGSSPVQAFTAKPKPALPPPPMKQPQKN